MSVSKYNANHGNINDLNFSREIIGMQILVCHLNSCHDQLVSAIPERVKDGETGMVRQGW